MTIDQAISLPHRAEALGRATDRLPARSVYNSVAARQAFFDSYDRIVARARQPIRGMSVPTRFGQTHISVTGSPDARPLLLLPGMMICGPLMLEFFDSLADDRMIIAPDLIGQPGLSADTVFTPSHHAYGKWISDVLDGIELEKVDILGPSFGGSIALDLAELTPERIGKLALVVAAGLTPSMPFLKVYTPLYLSWYLYRLLPLRAALDPISAPMCREWEPQNRDYFELIIRNTNFWRHRPASGFVPGQFKNVLDPVFIAFSRQDYMLPFKATRAHAHRVLPIGQEMIMDGSTHLPTAADMVPVHAALRRFFAA